MENKLRNDIIWLVFLFIVCLVLRSSACACVSEHFSVQICEYSTHICTTRIRVYAILCIDCDVGEAVNAGSLNQLNIYILYICYI